MADSPEEIEAKEKTKVKEIMGIENLRKIMKSVVWVSVGVNWGKELCRMPDRSWS